MRSSRRGDISAVSPLRLSLGASVGLVLLTAAVVAAVLGVLVWWALGRPVLAGGAPWSARDTFDLAKIVLAVLAGVGGIVALVVAYRRQRLGEAAEQREDEKLYLENFARATDQIGSDRAPVRVAAMHVLERLAQDNPTKRQTVVNVLCAYLRMPYTSQADGPGDREHEQERQVRLTAQRLLFLHLQPGTDPDRPTARYWPGLDVDLTGATLISLRFNDCRVRTGRFDDARLVGDATFERTRFDGNAWFRSAGFDGKAEFGGAHFVGLAEFRGSRFGRGASFDAARFDSDAGFRAARFEAPGTFDDARFAGATDFSGIEGTVEPPGPL